MRGWFSVSSVSEWCNAGSGMQFPQVRRLEDLLLTGMSH